jgi:hypothetical protein
MEALITSMTDHFVVTIIVGCVLASIIARAAMTMFTTAARERSRREIAAYIAEGTITAEQGERLIRADVNRGSGCP